MPHGNIIYRLVSAEEWRIAQAAGEFRGSADDLRDGYIHFSTRAQLEGTAAKHYRGREDLLVLAVSSAALGDALRWEPARNEQLFPHLYAPLPVSAVQSRGRVELAADGTHVLPADL